MSDPLKAIGSSKATPAEVAAGIDCLLASTKVPAKKRQPKASNIAAALSQKAANMVDKGCLFENWRTPKQVCDAIKAAFAEFGKPPFSVPLDLALSARKGRDPASPIDLDPCTDADDPVGSRAIWTQAEDGLAQSWRVCGFGTRVYANPPFGRGIADWMKKAAQAWHDGCDVALLLPSNRKETAYWQRWIAAGGPEAVTFVRKRIQFIDGNGKPGKANPYASELWWWLTGDLDQRWHKLHAIGNAMAKLGTTLTLGPVLSTTSDVAALT